jgi:hypothetical protein
MRSSRIRPAVVDQPKNPFRRHRLGLRRDGQVAVVLRDVLLALRIGEQCKACVTAATAGLPLTQRCTVIRLLEMSRTRAKVGVNLRRHTVVRQGDRALLGGVETLLTQDGPYEVHRIGRRGHVCFGHEGNREVTMRRPLAAQMH